VSTLILWGAKDRWEPTADAFRFQNDIKGARLEIFGKLGHNLIEEDTRASAAAVTAFLMPIPPAPRRRRNRRDRRTFLLRRYISSVLKKRTRR